MLGRIGDQLCYDQPKPMTLRRGKCAVFDGRLAANTCRLQNGFRQGSTQSLEEIRRGNRLQIGATRQELIEPSKGHHTPLCQIDPLPPKFLSTLPEKIPANRRPPAASAYSSSGDGFREARVPSRPPAPRCPLPAIERCCRLVVSRHRAWRPPHLKRRRAATQCHTAADASVALVRRCKILLRHVALGRARRQTIHETDVVRQDLPGFLLNPSSSIEICDRQPATGQRGDHIKRFRCSRPVYSRLRSGRAKCRNLDLPSDKGQWRVPEDHTQDPAISFGPTVPAVSQSPVIGEGRRSTPHRRTRARHSHLPCRASRRGGGQTRIDQAGLGRCECRRG